MMKKLILVLCAFLMAGGISYAGMLRTTPQNIVVGGITDQVEFVSATFYPGDNPYAVLRWNVITPDGKTVQPILVTVQNQLDDPETPEDESTTTLTEFVEGYWQTILTRSDEKGWAKIQELFTVQPK
jgi:hypothetical protein